jgi:hypothetical protein
MLWSKMCLPICAIMLMAGLSFADGDVGDQRIGLSYPGLDLGDLPGTGQGLSLLDPQRLDMSHSFGLIYSSDGKKGDMVGLYQNLLSYRFSPRLNLRVNLGFMHRPFLNSQASTGLNRQALMTAFQVDFRPLDNVFIRFDYRSLPVTGYRDTFWRR